jgi:serine protease AprX
LILAFRYEKLKQPMTPQEYLQLESFLSSADLAGGKVCPVCSREARDEFVPLAGLSESLQALIRANAPGGQTAEVVCRRCKELFERAEQQILSDAALTKDGSHVLSTPLRLDADGRFTGKDVTIAFLDSGFYPHVDLTQPSNRIIAYRNMAHGEGDWSSLEKYEVTSWHGMMTSVVAAGNGSLSNGFYRGIASDANVVLVKLERTRGITEQNIADGLEWVLSNRTKFNTKIVNVSVGGDSEKHYLRDGLSQLVEDCVRQGITVVCAVGNAGYLDNHPVFPPASAPSCIAVGGLDDDNSINRSRRGMYRSSYGPTIDGFQKPEIIAPSIWVPAPILPGTPTANQAKLYEELREADNADLFSIIKANAGVDAELDNPINHHVYAVRQIITAKLESEKVITRDYKYVDGTSFAAPIVSSVIAQMLEANPNLVPEQIKKILISTAERLPGYAVDRQGWGVIDPRRAVETALTFNAQV